MGLAATVYAQQLSSFQHGHPLWLPEPTVYVNNRTREVHPGDVGYFDEDGGFISLFNITVPAEDELNSAGVPESFQPVEYNKNLTLKREGYLQPAKPICSESVRVLDVTANVSG